MVAFWCGALNGFQVSSRIMRITDFQRRTRVQAQGPSSKAADKTWLPAAREGCAEPADRIANGATCRHSAISIFCKKKNIISFCCHSTRDDKARKSTRIYGSNKFFIGSERENKSVALWIKSQICLSKYRPWWVTNYMVQFTRLP